MNKLHRLQMLAAVALVILGVSSANAQTVCVPGTLVLDGGTPSDDVVFTYNGGGSADVAGFSLDIVWDISLATAVFTRPDNGPFNGAITFFVVDLGPGHVRIDSAIGGAHPGIPSGELFKGTFTGVASAVGTSGIALTTVYMRDSGNQDITGVPAPVDGSLDVDMVGLPTVENILIVNNTLAHTDAFVKDTDSITVTVDVSSNDLGFTLANIEADLTELGGGAAVNPDTYTAEVATWDLGSVTCTPADGLLTVTVTATDTYLNTANTSGTITADNTLPTALEGVVVTPGHEQLHLAWDEISGRDANPKGVEFRYVAWGDYPAYDSAAPAYPGDQLAGTLAFQEESLVSVDWSILPRDIYYVAGFVYDMVLNYSATGVQSEGRATNYWLGDIDGNGQVDVTPDIDALGDTYGLADTDGLFDPLCDVGPTDTGSPTGIPEPNNDHEVGFEDMMVFALNWSVVTPSTKVLEGGTPVLAWHQIDDTNWALSLEEKGGDMQGLNMRAELPDGVDCTVARGDLLAEQSGPIFLRNIPQHGIDAGLAQFGQGAGFSGSGELVRVTLSKPVEDIRVSVTARGADNKELSVELGSGGSETVPSVASFAQNYPNPFNPSTTLAYDLPQERQVHLAIYAVDGTRVRTLVEGRRGPGHHEVSWDGRDDTGRSVAAGTYFGRIVAGDLNQIRKMVLVK